MRDLLQTLDQSLSQSHASQVICVPKDISSVKDILKNPVKEETRSRLNNLRKLAVADTANPGTESLDIGFLFKGGLKMLKITDKGLKRSMRDTQKEAENDSDPGAGMRGNTRNIARGTQKPLSKLDNSALRYISRGQPLTKGQYARLERLEAAGYLRIENFASRADIATALTANKGKVSLSKYDCNIIKAIEKKDTESLKKNSDRIDNLVREGYLNKTDDGIIVQSRFYETRDELIRRGLLDDRDRATIENGRIRRNLPREQVQVIEALKRFSNLTEWQVYNIYKQSGREVYFQRDLREMQKKGLIEKQTSLGVTRKDLSKLVKDKNSRQSLLDHLREREYLDKQGIPTNKYKPGEKFDIAGEYSGLEEGLGKIFESKRLDMALYNLRYSGNKIGDTLVNNRNQSKQYTKNSKELLHDLLQYEAAKIIARDIEEKGGAINDIVIDRNRRAEIYTRNFKDIGDQNKQPIADIEIRYRDADGSSQVEYVEVDRGYDACVIKEKSAGFTQPVHWFTDSGNQAAKISKNAKTGDKIYLLS
ncbi:MAG: hypothetical protein ABIH39_00130 [Candidatus Margulisiibacteriota bacterium]